jgi:hypothetical protein
MTLRATLDTDLPRQALGTYQEDGVSLGRRCSGLTPLIGAEALNYLIHRERHLLIHDVNDRDLHTRLTATGGAIFS